MGEKLEKIENCIYLSPEGKIVTSSLEVVRKDGVVGVRVVEDAKKISIELKGAKGLLGKDFEDFLSKNLPSGSPGFSKGGRDFDVVYENGTKWVEAKSGKYWIDQTSTESGLLKFKSDMGDRLRIAKENGVEYELFSNTPIPENIKKWLISKGINFYEILD